MFVNKNIEIIKNTNPAILARFALEKTRYIRKNTNAMIIWVLQARAKEKNKAEIKIFS